MTDITSLISALLAGALLGAIFFGGLWWTVRMGISSSRVAFWFLLSMLLRSAIVMFGFYFVMGDSWQKLLAGLLGFTIARLLVMRFTRRANQPDHLPDQLKQESGHAS